MSLESLLQERNELRKEIEERRKQNENVLISIREFLGKIKYYTDICKENDISTDCVHRISGINYQIKCNAWEFKIVKFNANKQYDGCYLHVERDKVSSCVVGNHPTLTTITEKSGFLNPDAKWFKDNMEAVISCLDAALEECVKNQIEEAKKLLAGETQEE